MEGNDGEPSIEWNDTGRAFLQTRGRAIKRAKHGLGRFIALAQGSDYQVLSFVHAFGALRFTENGKIHTGGFSHSGDARDGTLRIDLGSEDVGLKRPTPVSWYRLYATYFRAIHRLAVSAERGEGGDGDDWKVIGRAEYFPRTPSSRDAWTAVTLHCQSLIRRCGVGLTLMESPLIPIASGSRPRISLKGHGLWGALAVQLLYAVTGGQAQAICCVCGQVFSPARRPQSGRRVYCPDHGKASGWREAKRVSQQEHRKARAKRS